MALLRSYHCPLPIVARLMVSGHELCAVQSMPSPWQGDGAWFCNLSPGTRRQHPLANARAQQSHGKEYLPQSSPAMHWCHS
eukprot:scaffold64590_cov32-Tisochrysis_lutea.AAC.1